MKDLFLTLLDQARGVWRFRWIAMLTAWAVCIVGWSLVIFIPDTYEANARIFVDTRTTLGRATEGLGVATSIDNQIARVREAIIGLPQLEEVVKQLDLEPPGLTPKEHQAFLAKVRQRIEIGGSAAGSNNPTAGVFTLSYYDQDRERGLEVVRLLVKNFVEGTLGGSRASSMEAEQFLVQQIADYEKRLSEAEDRLAAFKRQYVGLMPGAQGDYFTRLQAEIDATRTVEGSLDLAQRKRDELTRQLRGEQPVLPGAASSAAARTPTAPTEGSANAGAAGPTAAVAATPVPATVPAAGGAAGNDTGTRIRETQARLDELLLRFTEKHPDVIALKSTLDELKQRQQAEINALRRGDLGAAAQVGLSANPVYQSIQLQLNQVNVEIATLRGQAAEHQSKMAELRQLMNTAPQVEAEFARLNRGYDVTKAQYQALVDRLDRTRLSDRADQTGVVSFEVIDPPTSSFTPIAPDRPMMVAMVLVAGIALGGAIAYLLHQLKPIFTSVRQLAEVTGQPVLGVVSMTWLEKHRAARRRAAILYACTAMLLVLFAGAAAVFQGHAARIVHEMIEQA